MPEVACNPCNPCRHNLTNLQARDDIAWAQSQGAQVVFASAVHAVPPPTQVDVVLVHDKHAVKAGMEGASGTLHFPDYLVCGVLVLSVTFLRALRAAHRAQVQVTMQLLEECKVYNYFDTGEGRSGLGGTPKSHFQTRGCWGCSWRQRSQPGIPPFVAAFLMQCDLEQPSNTPLLLCMDDQLSGQYHGAC